MKQIRVSNSCSGCGVCVLTCKYLQENDDGNAEPVPGMAILEEDIENVNEVIHSCPERAITIYETGLTNKTGKAGIEEFKEKAIELIKKIPKMKYPSLREYQFKKEEYSIDYSYPRGQNQYDYSSYDRAKRAGEDEFDRIIHSQLEVIFTKVFMEYKTKYIKPYYTLTDEERNAYSEHNKEIQKTLSNICAEAKSLGISDNQLNGNKFLECSVFPFGDDAKWCRNHEFMGKDMVKRLVDEFKKDEDKGYYTCEIDVDRMEFYEGTGFWGDKYKTKWCYSGVNAAARKLSEDILYFFSWADINERCEQFVNYLIEDYNKNLEEFIESKIKMIRNIDENNGKKNA